MDEWRIFGLTVIGFLTASGTAIKIFGKKNDPDVEGTIKELQDTVKGLSKRVDSSERLQSGFTEVHSRVERLGKEYSSLEVQLRNLEKLIDEHKRDSDKEDRAIWDEISSFQQQLTVTMQKIAADLAYLTGRLGGANGTSITG